MFVSHDVIFNEKCFPFAGSKEENPSNYFSQDDTHCFWQIDGVIDDDWNYRQNPTPIVDPLSPSANLGPLVSGSSPGQPHSSE